MVNGYGMKTVWIGDLVLGHVLSAISSQKHGGKQTRVIHIGALEVVGVTTAAREWTEA